MSLKDLINERTESLEDLSAHVGVSRQTLNNILKDKASPSLLTIKKICDYFGADYKNFI